MFDFFVLYALGIINGGKGGVKGCNPVGYLYFIVIAPNVGVFPLMFLKQIVNRFGELLSTKTTIKLIPVWKVMR